MAVMLTFLKVPLTWPQILRRTFNEAFFEDNCFGMAAQLAYYFFFALFPALLMLIALASYFPYHTLVNDMFASLGGFAPQEVLTIITDQLGKIASGKQGGLFTIGMLTTIWSTSSAMTAIIDTLNAAYDIQEGRPWWKVRIIAITLTVGVAVFIVISFGLVLVGPALATHLADRFYLGDAFEWSWKILQWPVVFGLVSAAIAVIYYYAPDAEQDWVWLTPGSIMATTLWLLASLAFKYYVANLGKYTETYGAIGGVMILLLWFYISALVILIGAEMNAEIEHASPYGKEEGEKVAGEKQKIGAARWRAWMSRHRKSGGKPPSADEVKAAVGEPPPEKQPGAPLPPSEPLPPS
ncbi:MAG TPA: YihY/virulence factor BrkB family protein [Vicinamibacterales bacterium]|nr:YihY/virulence factor BrkB family protein [Vicinamibacterales bacterium]